MPILRVNKESGYTRCSNKHVHQSKTLGFGARGLLGYLLSHGDGWKFYRSVIVSDTPKEGRDAVNTLLEELIAAKHLKIEGSRADDGCFDGGEWFVSEEPMDELGKSNRCGKPAADNPTWENPQLQTNNQKQTKNIQTPLPPQGVLVGVELKEVREPQYPPTFEEWWAAYGRVGGKAEAFKSWLKACKHATHEKLVRKAKEYREFCIRKERYQKDGSTWLNNSGWDNDYAAQLSNHDIAKPKLRQETFADSFNRVMAVPDPI